MKKYILFLLFLVPFAAIAAMDVPVNIALSPVKVNTHDKASILRGAKFFANNCMSCHTMKYLQHNKIAKEAGITLDKMPLKNTKWWLGVAPPDLTLIARQRSPQWIYTYLHSFYKDPSRPTGYNNLLAPNIVMMNVLAPLQGVQELNKKAIARYTNTKHYSKPQYYSVLEMVRSGSMSPQEYNRTITDLVNFLVYAGDPHKAQREELGWWVIGFLVLLLILAYPLKRLYWKKVK